MIVAESGRAQDGYALARTPQEYERLRAQAAVWESATARLLDEVGLAAGERCLDAGCGPGETMRLMAQRVGPSGRVVGVDADARLLLFHLPERVAVLRRLWETVSPGGRLLVQDYDLRTVGALPALESVEEFLRVTSGAFSAAGCDVRVGVRLPELFVQAGIGAPDGTDVSGRLEALVDARGMLVSVYESLLPTALAQGVTTERRAAAWLSELAHDVERFPDRSALWPLLIGAWKRKPAWGERSA